MLTLTVAFLIAIKRIDGDLGAYLMLIMAMLDFIFTPLIIYSIGDVFCS
jgi:hypothetical protein